MNIALPGLPARGEVYEVGPDGLQNESVVVPAPSKAEFVRHLLVARPTTVKLTSFFVGALGAVFAEGR